MGRERWAVRSACRMNSRSSQQVDAGVPCPVCKSDAEKLNGATIVRRQLKRSHRLQCRPVTGGPSPRRLTICYAAKTCSFVSPVNVAASRSARLRHAMSRPIRPPQSHCHAAGVRSRSSMEAPSGPLRKAMRVPGRTVTGPRVKTAPLALRSAQTASISLTSRPK